ncbi:MAG: hypothetical protein AABX64_02970 [Nanoarchaeota archaeon]
MADRQFSWKFPLQKFLVLRIEGLFLLILAVLMYLTILYRFDKEAPVAVGFTVLFLAMYALLSFAIQRWRSVEEHYKVTKNYLEVVRKKKNKTKKEKAFLKDVVHHKLDKVFLGGYVVTKKGKKHLLFFNTKQELEKFESFLKKHLKP